METQTINTEKQSRPMGLVKRSGAAVVFDMDKVVATIHRCAQGVLDDIDINVLLAELQRTIFDGIGAGDLERALILASTAFIERDPAYNVLATRLYLQRQYKEVMKVSVDEQSLQGLYKEKFIQNIKHGVAEVLFDARFAEFPLERLAEALRPERDQLFRYIGIHTLYERYFVRSAGAVLELPQAFWMRVAMGLALNEHDRFEKTLEFYNAMSTLHYVPSTPTLFHAGTTHPQLSSCYLTFVDDDLNHIFKSLQDQANLSKWSGGIGSDWTSLRAIGSRIKSIQVDSQGIVPFLKIANDVVAAISRSGSRRGAACVYLEVWHLDYEDFLDLRRNTGDERRRTHDMSTASWIPDLFMKRVINNQEWTLFSPDEVPDLHDLYGKEFEAAYCAYEQKAQQGVIKHTKKLSAAALWRKMLGRLFETGHPWPTFKDACNVRSPQDHVGVIHSSNLCTEITLNTSRDETAVCNLGSINLSRHIVDGALDEVQLAATIKTAVRMLDNAIDVNFYPTIEAQNSNVKHRPLGLGVMGLQDALYKLDIAFDDQLAFETADALMETIAHQAIAASALLAQERGAYASYKGSKWDRGLFPQDTIALLEAERGMPIEVDRTSRLDWTPVRALVKQYGMRNSNVLAIAPTATISNIAGCYPSIEPIYKNLYVKANMSGEFTIVNEYLVNDLKKRGLWSKDLLDTIKYFDGNIQMIEAIPQELRSKYQEAFDLDPEWMIKITAARSKWIDQSQSHNVFMKGADGQKLSAIYLTAWKLGLKTCYYLRSLAASQIEKSTLDAKKFGFTQKREYGAVEGAKTCGIDGGDCESCQ